MRSWVNCVQTMLGLFATIAFKSGQTIWQAVIGDRRAPGHGFTGLRSCSSLAQISIGSSQINANAMARLVLFAAPVCVPGLLGASPAWADPTLTTLIQFNGTDGAYPVASLISDGAGNLYGTTAAGGPDYVNLNQIGNGTVFKYNIPSQTLTTLASFSDSNGAGVRGGVLLDQAGDLFGATSNNTPGEYGTIFEIPAGGGINTLVSFNGSNGAFPVGGLATDAAGNLYGTTAGGGATWVDSNNTGEGTIFQIAAGSHAFSTVFSFSGTNGSEPFATLIPDSAGNFYGTTYFGGPAFTGDPHSGNGTVLKFNPVSNQVTSVASFNGSNGEEIGGLVADRAGNLYGTSEGGGTDGDGSIFEIPAGTNNIVTLVNFNGPDGVSPEENLIIDAAGNLYGVTSNGGSSYENTNLPGYGSVFKIDAITHNVTTLASFTGPNGQYPFGGLITDAQGNLYGTTEEDSVTGLGTLYEITDSGFVVPEPSVFALSILTGAAFMRRIRTR